MAHGAMTEPPRPPETAAPWRRLARRLIYERAPWLRLYRDRLELPDGRVVEDYHRLETPDYVVVAAETEAGEVLCLRQYRQGVGAVCLCLPGGMIDPGESPAAAAARELLEETGYVAGTLRPLHSVVALANLHGATGHLFHAAGCRKVAAPASGDLEVAELRLLDRAALDAAIRAGEIKVASNLLAATLLLGGF